MLMQEAGAPQVRAASPRPLPTMRACGLARPGSSDPVQASRARQGAGLQGTPPPGPCGCGLLGATPGCE